MRISSQKLQSSVIALIILVIGITGLGIAPYSDVKIEEEIPVEEPRSELPCIDKTFSIVVHIVKDSLGEANVTEGAIQGEVAGLENFILL